MAVDLALSAAENALLKDSGCDAPMMDESDRAVIGLVLKWVHHRHHAVTEAQLLHQEVFLHAASTPSFTRVLSSTIYLCNWLS